MKAAVTRAAVLAAARRLFVEKGYVATSVAEIAKAARVNADTVYVAAGRKPQLLRALVESAISGTDDAVPAEQRGYVVRIRAATGAEAGLSIYAPALSEIQPEGWLPSIFLSLSEAARTDTDCATLWSEISRRRAQNMRLFAADLRATGQLRADLSDEEVADIVWSLNGPEYYAMLVGERGWTVARFTAWLADAWVRLLLH